ncbi:MAG: hypothetical protein J6Y54_06500 [Lentisphaeria bacterium]|nr:hypothetical protein [Lentisphaeria bacterium]
MEIKAGMTFDPSFAKNIRAFMEIAEACVKPTVIYAGDTTTTINGVTFDNFRNTSKLIAPEN